VRLLTALKPTGENLWVVGDAKQSIYRFRGASSFNMARFGREDFPGGFETAWTSTTAPPQKSSAPSPPSRPA
jgi:superfamily I DNA/RNA helicase